MTEEELKNIVLASTDQYIDQKNNPTIYKLIESEAGKAIRGFLYTVSAVTGIFSEDKNAAAPKSSSLKEKETRPEGLESLITSSGLLHQFLLDSQVQSIKVSKPEKKPLPKTDDCEVEEDIKFPTPDESENDQGLKRVRYFQHIIHYLAKLKSEESKKSNLCTFIEAYLETDLKKRNNALLQWSQSIETDEEINIELLSDGNDSSNSLRGIIRYNLGYARNNQSNTAPLEFQDLQGPKQYSDSRLDQIKHNLPRVFQILDSLKEKPELGNLSELDKLLQDEFDKAFGIKLKFDENELIYLQDIIPNFKRTAPPEELKKLFLNHPDQKYVNTPKLFPKGNFKSFEFDFSAPWTEASSTQGGANKFFECKPNQYAFVYAREFKAANEFIREYFIRKRIEEYAEKQNDPSILNLFSFQYLDPKIIEELTSKLPDAFGILKKIKRDHASKITDTNELNDLLVKEFKEKFHFEVIFSKNELTYLQENISSLEDSDDTSKYPEPLQELLLNHFLQNKIANHYELIESLKNKIPKALNILDTLKPKLPSKELSDLKELKQLISNLSKLIGITELDTVQKKLSQLVEFNKFLDTPIELNSTDELDEIIKKLIDLRSSKQESALIQLETLLKKDFKYSELNLELSFNKEELGYLLNTLPELYQYAPPEKLKDLLFQKFIQHEGITHPNRAAVKLYQADGKNYYGQENLKDFIAKTGERKYSNEQMFSVVQQILYAFYHLGKAGISHDDPHAENIQVIYNGDPKDPKTEIKLQVFDFGNSQLTSSDIVPKNDWMYLLHRCSPVVSDSVAREALYWSSIKSATIDKHYPIYRLLNKIDPSNKLLSLFQQHSIFFTNSLIYLKKEGNEHLIDYYFQNFILSFFEDVRKELNLNVTPEKNPYMNIMNSQLMLPTPSDNYEQKSSNPTSKPNIDLNLNSKDQKLLPPYEEESPKTPIYSSSSSSSLSNPTTHSIDFENLTAEAACQLIQSSPEAELRTAVLNAIEKAISIQNPEGYYYSYVSSSISSAGTRIEALNRLKKEIELGTISAYGALNKLRHKESFGGWSTTGYLSGYPSSNTSVINYTLLGLTGVNVKELTRTKQPNIKYELIAKGTCLRLLPKKHHDQSQKTATHPPTPLASDASIVNTLSQQNRTSSNEVLKSCPDISAKPTAVRTQPPKPGFTEFMHEKYEPNDTSTLTAPNLKK